MVKALVGAYTSHKAVGGSVEKKKRQQQKNTHTCLGLYLLYACAGSVCTHLTLSLTVIKLYRFIMAGGNQATKLRTDADSCNQMYTVVNNA